ncbi:MAG: DUF2877 domain-containing protein [Betaproteobacteria bacterium]|nr:DUF2877 domain-containing protein [Betaproteobacteria bacterium]
MNAVLGIGARALTALRASGGRASPLDAFPDAPYFLAAGEIIWVGSRLPARHPRAVLTAIPAVRGRIASFAALPRDAWSAALPSARHDSFEVVAAACRRLIASIDSIGDPRGFGEMLAGRVPAFPLDLAIVRVNALAAAYRADNSDAVYTASRALLGFGTGLTPSGDDLCGGALFGRMLVSSDLRWREIGERLARDVRSASHAISAALFADLVAGASFEPLHALADALSAGDDPAAIDAASALAALGHSSGWDMLSGFAIGLAAEECLKNWRFAVPAKAGINNFQSPAGCPRSRGRRSSESSNEDFSGNNA